MLFFLLLLLPCARERIFLFQIATPQRGRGRERYVPREGDRPRGEGGAEGDLPLQTFHFIELMKELRLYGIADTVQTQFLPTSVANPAPYPAALAAVGRGRGG